jgi:hypothetical protein
MRPSRRKRRDTVIETDFLDDLATFEAQHRSAGEVHLCLTDESGH